MKITNGWLDTALHVKSPNFNERPVGAIVNLLVVHNISLPPAQFDNPYIELFFQNELPIDEHPYFATIAGMEVSSHFLIKRSGEIIQFVSCDQRAWHAGNSNFCGQDNCNDFSIGVELEGTDTLPYESVQYQRLAELTHALKAAYPAITWERTVGHCDIAPGRKTDPGESFDWDCYQQLLTG